MKKSFKDLQVWKKSIDLAEAIYKATEDFPQREHFGLAAQIRKSAVSIASNISEGSARHSNKEFQQFLIIARGSSAELQTQMLIAMRVGYFEKRTYIALSKQLNEIGRMLHGLKRSLTAMPKKLTTID
jgi:four helix bundle protein